MMEALSSVPVLNSMILRFCLAAYLLCVPLVAGNPQSKPFIAYRTDAMDQKDVLHHTILPLPPDTTKSTIHRYDRIDNSQCPLQFSLGTTKTPHSHHQSNPIRAPPVLGPGGTVYTTHHAELLDRFHPHENAELLIQDAEYPVLLEGSIFLTSPILHDVNRDGQLDAIVADYDGGIYVIGPSHFAKTQVPRLLVRKAWVESRLNETLGVEKSSPEGEEAADYEDPFHTYFESLYHQNFGESVLQGVGVNGLDSEQWQQVKERRSRRVSYDPTVKEPEKKQGGGDDEEDDDEPHLHRRLQEVEEVVDGDGSVHAGVGTGDQMEQLGDMIQHNEEGHGDHREHQIQEDHQVDPPEPIDGEALVSDHHEADHRLGELEHDTTSGENHRMELGNMLEDLSEERELEEHVPEEDDLTVGMEDREADAFYLDDITRLDSEERHEHDKEVDDFAADDMYGGERDHDDEYGRYGRYGYDDMYGGGDPKRNEYFDEKHYVRITPHILCTPVLAEFPRLYANGNEMDDILFVAVSYYMDEDAYDGFFSYKRFSDAGDHGGGHEATRGLYVASAIMAYNFGESHSRWLGQNHLDLSTDFSAPENATLVGVVPIREDLSGMGAFALSSPTVADIDGDGEPEILVGTSMGILYCFHARHLYKKGDFPVQLENPIESRVLVEDVTGDTKLEIFVADVAGNVICLSHDAKVLWSRKLSHDDGEVTGYSPMTLGDIDGDGTLDVVIVVSVEHTPYVFGLNAVTGKDLSGFPIALDDYNPQNVLPPDEVAWTFAQPLLVDLHSEQRFIDDYIRRNGTKWATRSAIKSRNPPHGGSASGLHVVVPIGQALYIIEAGSGCSQKLSIGQEVSTMVQVDDIHGTNRLDLLVATESGNIVTFESGAPFHPLNTWTNGELRGRGNAHSHGYSASQGIFVHEKSRSFNDVFGVYVPITFEIFDNRPNIRGEPEKMKYRVEIRDGPSSGRALFRFEYTAPGVYTERVYIRYGPGFYKLYVVMHTSNGLIYQDNFSVGYNVSFLQGFGVLLWLPLFLMSAAILLCGSKKTSWDDEDYDGGRDNHQGILGRAMA